MKSPVRACIFATAFTAITCVGIADDVEAGNGWGWAKPLNQKPGSVLYTSNRKNRQHTTSHRAFRVRTYTQPKFIAPVHYPHVTVQSPTWMMESTPATRILGQPSAGSRIVQPPVKAPSPLDGWLVP